MVAPSRWRGVLLATLALAAATGLVDLALTAAVGPADGWAPYGEKPHDRWVVDAAGSRLSGLALDGWGGAEARPLGVLFGQSTLQCGVDAEALSARPGESLRFLNLFGIGGSINKINEISNLLVYSGIRPALVVLAINDYMLAGVPGDREAARGDRGMAPWLRAAKERVWTWRNRRIVNYLSRVAADRARFAIFRAAGVGIGAMYPPDPDPWQSMKVVDKPLGEAEWAAWLREMVEMGRFEPERFRADGSNARSLAGLVRRHRALGAAVVVVRLPMHSQVRDMVPPEADRCLEAVRGEFAGRPVPIIDLHDAVPDGMFNDVEHLGARGRATCTRLLAERLPGAIARDRDGGADAAEAPGRDHP